MTTNGEAWNDEVEPIKTALASLPPKERSAFALACAERLVKSESDERRTELDQFLTHGWAVFESGTGTTASIRAAMVDRPDIDDDPVAAVFYALESVDGQFQNTWWVANRAIDASFEHVLYPENAVHFRTFSEDLGAESVQRELTWQRESLDLLKHHGATLETVQSLRITRQAQARAEED